MKKSILAIIFLTISIIALAQSSVENTKVGVRLGASNGLSGELTFQHWLVHNTRYEIDLGFGDNLSYDYWSVTGLYQWVFPLYKDFDWYAGCGLMLGGYSHQFKNDDGIAFSVRSNVGVEYNFPDLPIQFSIDTRPEMFISRISDRFGMDIGFSARYSF